MGKGISKVDSDASTFKVLLINVDLLNLLLSTAVALSPRDSAYVFGATAILVLLVFLLYLIRKIVNECRNNVGCDILSSVAYVSILVGGVLYYLGDNLPQLLQKFNLPEEDMEVVRYTSAFTLVMAVILLRLMPFVVSKCEKARKKARKGKSKKDNGSDYAPHKFGIVALGMVVEVDAIYTGMLESIGAKELEAEEECKRRIWLFKLFAILFLSGF